MRTGGMFCVVTNGDFSNDVRGLLEGTGKSS